MTSFSHAASRAPALPFEAVLAGLAQGVCITGPGGDIMWTNPAAQRILGGAPHPGMPFDALLARCGTRLAMRRAPWQDDAGNHGEIITFHAMPASPATVALRALFEDTPVLVVLFHGAAHTYLFANAAYRNVLIGGADPVGRTLLEMLPEADTQGFVGVMDQVFASGQPYVAHETRFDLALPDGTSKTMYFNLVFEPVRDATGVIEGTLLVAADVTEAVVYRDVARQSQRQLQIALESGRMGSWRIDVDTNVLSADATFRALHNAAEHEDTRRPSPGWAIRTTSSWSATRSRTRWRTAFHTMSSTGSLSTAPPGG